MQVHERDNMHNMGDDVPFSKGCNDELLKGDSLPRSGKMLDVLIQKLAALEADQQLCEGYRVLVREEVKGRELLMEFERAMRLDMCFRAFIRFLATMDQEEFEARLALEENEANTRYLLFRRSKVECKKTRTFSFIQIAADAEAALERENESLDCFVQGFRIDRCAGACVAHEKHFTQQAPSSYVNQPILSEIAHSVHCILCPRERAGRERIVHLEESEWIEVLGSVNVGLCVEAERQERHLIRAAESKTFIMLWEAIDADRIIISEAREWLESIEPVHRFMNEYARWAIAKVSSFITERIFGRNIKRTVNGCQRQRQVDLYGKVLKEIARLSRSESKLEIATITQNALERAHAFGVEHLWQAYRRGCDQLFNSCFELLIESRRHFHNTRCGTEKSCFFTSAQQLLFYERVHRTTLQQDRDSEFVRRAMEAKYQI